MTYYYVHFKFLRVSTISSLRFETPLNEKIFFASDHVVIFNCVFFRGLFKQFIFHLFPFFLFFFVCFEIIQEEIDNM